ncbi:ribonuclease P protein component [Gayadomonas joobiniege]|uniref:ribonuclease P protein component n=1 Tax=Gayadomonas joobiniege TaxID=1234606 RepID=UPI00058F9097|nr:ribonuclease P protein component [Gayadomonas joobiniege]
MKTYAYKRELRLLTPADFQSVFDARPKKFSCRYYTILAAKSNFDKPRLGFTISKKKARFAVQRNKIKRVARDSFRLQQHELPNVDMVFIAKQGIALASNETLRHELEYTWKKIKRHMKS